MSSAVTAAGIHLGAAGSTAGLGVAVVQQQAHLAPGVRAISRSTITSVHHRLPKAVEGDPVGVAAEVGGAEDLALGQSDAARVDSSSRMRLMCGPVVSTM
jgi:hypothetical protein